MNLSHRKLRTHVSERSSVCTKAFYVLQAAGLCNLETNVDTTYVWKTAIWPVLIDGLDTVKIDKTRMNEFESMQGKLVKVMLGLHKYYIGEPLMKALRIPQWSPLWM